MKISLTDLTKSLDATLVGDASILVSGAAEPDLATATQIAIATNQAYMGRLADGQARCALLADGADWHALGLEAAIFVKRPRFAMIGITRAFDTAWRVNRGIHPTAIIDSTANIGDDASIGAYSIVGPNVRVGSGLRIGNHVTIADGATLGEDATLFDGVKIGHHVTIGDRVILHPGSVIGADGFSFVTPEPSGVEAVRDSLGDQGELKQQSWHRIHSLGAVTLGDDVEVGANSTIDRGTIRDTQVGHRCKFDNFAHIGHNVQIGNDCLICGHVGVAGSSRLGNNVVLGGQTGISDNIFVGDNVITGGATKVLANVPAGRVMLGYPATKMDQQMDMYRALRKLPRMMKEFASLKKSISKDD